MQADLAIQFMLCTIRKEVYKPKKSRSKSSLQRWVQPILKKECFRQNLFVTLSRRMDFFLNFESLDNDSPPDINHFIYRIQFSSGYQRHVSDAYIAVKLDTLARRTRNLASSDRNQRHAIQRYQKHSSNI